MPTNNGMEEGEHYSHGCHTQQRGQDDFVWPPRTNVDVFSVVHDACARVDHLHTEM